ncbi:MAG: PAS domain S-box protein [Ignavibacteriales bacterium]|nr:PAS domain S-box protein [Ignavibacteriales bacterium]
MATPPLVPNRQPYQQPLTLLSFGRENHTRTGAVHTPDQQALLESVWENSAEAMRITNAAGIIVAVNDSYCRMVGMRREELVGEPFTVILDSSADPSVLLATYSKRFLDRSVEPVMNRHLRLRNHHEVFVEAINSYIKGTDGSTFVFSIIRNVTTRRIAERALKESERKYHDLFNNAVQGIFQSTVDGKLLSANAALLRMLGYDSIEELASINLEELYTNPAERASLTMKLSGQGACSNVELSLRRKDGKTIIVLEHSRAVKDAAGNVVSIEGILEDITERKELEARVQENLSALQDSREMLTQLNRQKDRLMSVLSHDLQSPFTSILGFCEILLNDTEKLTDAERKEFLTYIRNSAQQQLALVKRLLDWSRLETGRITLDIRDIDLQKVVRASVQAHLGTAMNKEIALRSTLPADTCIRGDEAMLTQAFNNLISNALKFTPAHGLISIDLKESADEEWILTVKDTGAGIPAADLKRLFKVEEKYTRVGLRGETGTGLGLSLVAEIIKKHSGSITVESEVGAGTTFTIRLHKLAKPQDEAVLVVDDDQGVRVLHSRYLKRMFPDAQVVQASNGNEAFDYAKKYHPRLIVTDYSMPGMNGFEFLKLVKQDPETKDIPVFIITGKDSADGRESLVLSGAEAVLTKPVSSKELQDAVEGVLASRI